MVANDCFADMDDDNVPDHLDNCPGTPNPGQEASFGQDVGDVEVAYNGTLRFGVADALPTTTEIQIGAGATGSASAVGERR